MQSISLDVRSDRFARNSRVGRDPRAIEWSGKKDREDPVAIGKGNGTRTVDILESGSTNQRGRDAYEITTVSFLSLPLPSPFFYHTTRMDSKKGSLTIVES